MRTKTLSNIKFRFFLIGILLALWWWVDRICKDDKKPVIEAPTRITIPDQPQIDSIPTKSQELFRDTIHEEPEAKIEPKPSKKREDDLRQIEGIGPKISAILKQAGINTYKKLGNLEPEKIKSILDQENIRLANPGTWPEQARLAAAGNWDQLKELQSQLKGGRRV